LGWLIKRFSYVLKEALKKPQPKKTGLPVNSPILSQHGGVGSPAEGADRRNEVEESFQINHMRKGFLEFSDTGKVLRHESLLSSILGSG